MQRRLDDLCLLLLANQPPSWNGNGGWRGNERAIPCHCNMYWMWVVVR